VFNLLPFLEGEHELNVTKNWNTPLGGDVQVIEKYQIAIAQLLETRQVPFSCDANSLTRASQDFGNMLQGRSQVVIQPRDVQDIVALLQIANHEHLAITPRGSGCSQSGQSVSPDGITLEISRFDTIQVFTETELVRCGAGTTWRQLAVYLGSQGLLPCVMPLNLNLTVGGTLSAGGFGANSHRFGTVIANVKELEVVTGAGECVTCSQTENLDVFDAVLGGVGRCAVMTAATLKLRRIRSQVRTYYLIYDDINTWLCDQQQLQQVNGIDYLEGFCSASVQGLYKTPTGRSPLVHWLYGLHVGVEFELAQPPQAEQVLQGLRYSRLLYTEDDATVAYMSRYDVRYQAMQQSGSWRQPHPWFDCLLPLEIAGEVIPKILDILPMFFGDGHRIILLADQQTPRYFMKPEDAPACLFAVLPTGIPTAFLEPALAALEQVNDLVIQAGGKRYLSGWLGNMTTEAWQLHFGSQYSYWQNLKQQFDPNNILRSRLFP
jgi:cytokinin dehydrogenase